MCCPFCLWHFPQSFGHLPEESELSHLGCQWCSAPAEGMRRQTPDETHGPEGGGKAERKTAGCLRTNQKQTPDLNRPQEEGNEQQCASDGKGPPKQGKVLLFVADPRGHHDVGDRSPLSLGASCRISQFSGNHTRERSANYHYCRDLSRAARARDCTIPCTPRA